MPRKMTGRMELQLARVVEFAAATVRAHEAYAENGQTYRGVANWITETTVKAYVKANLRWRGSYGRYFVPSLQIANVVVHHQYQGRGAFKHLIEEFEKIADMHDRELYVDNVLNDRIMKHLDARPGWRREVDGRCLSYVRENPKAPRLHANGKPMNAEEIAAEERERADEMAKLRAWVDGDAHVG